MTSVEVPGEQSTVFVDDRETALRVSWHPNQRVVAFSHWRHNECRSTFYVANGDIARLAAFLVGVLGDAASRPVLVAAPPRPSVRERLRAGIAALLNPS